MRTFLVGTQAHELMASSHSTFAINTIERQPGAFELHGIAMGAFLRWATGGCATHNTRSLLIPQVPGLWV